MNVTLRDVAAAAGVSQATASRALGDTGTASPATRRRVRAVAQRLGYEANSVARSLRTQRTDTIGLLVPDLRNPFFTDLAYAVDKAALNADRTVMIGSADEDPALADRYLRSLARHQVDGVLVVPQGDASATLTDAARLRPTVFIDRDPGLDIPVVSSDNHGGMAALIDHIIGLGHRRIGIIAGPQTASTGRQRLAAARERLDGHGIDLPDHHIAVGDFRLDSGIVAAETLLAHPDRPDVIVAADNLMGLGALLVAQRRGLAIGRDLGLAVFDDSPWFTLLPTPVTVVAQETAELGRVAVDLLLQAIGGAHPQSVCLPTRLIVRGSLGEGATHTEENHA